MRAGLPDRSGHSRQSHRIFRFDRGNTAQASIMILQRRLRGEQSYVDCHKTITASTKAPQCAPLENTLVNNALALARLRAGALPEHLSVVFLRPQNAARPGTD